MEPCNPRKVRLKVFMPQRCDTQYSRKIKFPKNRNHQKVFNNLRPYYFLNFLKTKVTFPYLTEQNPDFLSYKFSIFSMLIPGYLGYYMFLNRISTTWLRKNLLPESNSVSFLTLTVLPSSWKSWKGNLSLWAVGRLFSVMSNVRILFSGDKNLICLFSSPLLVHP